MFNVVIFSDLTNSIISGLTLGPYKCAHVLRQAGFSCLVINHMSSWTQNDLERVIDHAFGTSTYLVGFSTTFLEQGIYDDQGLLLDTKKTNHQSVFPQGMDFERSVIARIKKRSPAVKVAIGGARANADNTNPHVDYVVLGYSEKSIVNLVEHLAHGTALTKSYRSLWHKTILDDKAASDYHFPSGTMQWLPEDVINHRLLPLEVARGCIFKCKFCAYPMNGKQQLDFVRYPELLAQEINDNYHRYGIKHYQIVDDTFNDHREKLVALRDVVASLDFDPVFWGYHRLDLICTRPDTLQILYDIGVRAMFFGIETLYQPTGKVIGKGFDPARLIDMIRFIKANYPDISLHGSFILGLPGEPIASMIDTYDKIRSRTIPLDSWIFNALRINQSGDLTFDSEINLDPAKFGYINQGGVSDHPGLINWQNEHLDYATARSLAQRFMQESHQSNDLKLTGQMALELFDMGMDFDVARSTAWQNIDWHNIRTQLKASFQKRYREQIIKIVHDKNLSHLPVSN